MNLNNDDLIALACTATNEHMQRRPEKLQIKLKEQLTGLISSVNFYMINDNTAEEIWGYIRNDNDLFDFVMSATDTFQFHIHVNGWGSQLNDVLLYSFTIYSDTLMDKAITDFKLQPNSESAETIFNIRQNPWLCYILCFYINFVRIVTELEWDR